MTASGAPADDGEADGCQLLRAPIFDVDGVPVDPHGKAWHEPLHELMESDWSDTATARRGRRKRSPRR